MTILTADIDATTGEAYDTTTSTAVLVVAANVILTSDETNGINSGFGGALIVNYGAVTGSDAGLYSYGGSSSIIENKAGGVLAGRSYGFCTAEPGDVVLNDGSITSNFDALFDDVGSMYLENAGYIFGTDNGVTASSNDDLINSGTVSSAKVGVFFGGSSGASSLENTGMIRGSVDAITSLGAGKVTIANRGTIDGNVGLSDTGGDTVTNRGSIIGNVQLGNGTNTFDDRGGTVSGTITGGTGVDTIRAGSGGDTINGGAGHDQLYGGAGADTFVFSSPAPVNSDVVHGFNVSNDTIELTHAAFAKLVVGATPTFSIATAATSATDYLYYNTSSGNLYYDPDGTGPLVTHLIANLGAGLHLTAQNFTVV